MPIDLQALAAVRHVEGEPAQEPAQHSADVAHVAPSATQSAVQINGSWLVVRAQVPRQQSDVARQGAPMARHAPGPTSQR